MAKCMNGPDIESEIKREIWMTPNFGLIWKVKGKKEISWMELNNFF